MAELVSLDEIGAAAGRLRGVAVRTPLIPFTGQVKAASTLLIKPESLQPTGAFKLRGAYNAVYAVTRDLDSCACRRGGRALKRQSRVRRRVRGAAARHQRRHRRPGERARGQDRRDRVDRGGTGPGRADARRQDRGHRGDRQGAGLPPGRAVRRQGRDRRAGHDRPGDRRGLHRRAAQGAKPPAAVLVPVSGGGLISGIAVAVKALLPGTRVIGVEPELAADARDSLRAGTRVAWTSAQTSRTKADALRVEQVGELTFPHIQAYVDDIVTVSEDEMLDAIRQLARQARLIAEPGGAVAVAAALYRDRQSSWASPQAAEQPVVAVLSGGNIDPALLAEILQTESYTG